jgi:hypothetical protein
VLCWRGEVASLSSVCIERKRKDNYERILLLRESHLESMEIELHLYLLPVPSRY